MENILRHHYNGNDNEIIILKTKKKGYFVYHTSKNISGRFNYKINIENDYFEINKFKWFLFEETCVSDTIYNDYIEEVIVYRKTLENMDKDMIEVNGVYFIYDQKKNI